MFLFFIIYMLVINFISIVITIYDKKSAKRNKQRVPEKTLLLFSVLGGSVCMLLTMKKIKHKTKHKKFMVGIPVIIILQVLLVIFLLYLRYEYAGI